METNPAKQERRSKMRLSEYFQKRRILKLRQRELLIEQEKIKMKNMRLSAMRQAAREKNCDHHFESMPIVRIGAEYDSPTGIKIEPSMTRVVRYCKKCGMVLKTDYPE